MDNQLPDIIKKETVDLVKQATEYQIIDKMSFDMGAVITANLRKMEKILKERKELITKPLNSALKSARELFEPYDKQLKEAQVLLKSKIGDYQTKLQMEAFKKREEILKTVDPLVNDSELNNKLAEIDLEQKLAGGLYVRNDKEVVVVDEALIPDKYWEINMVLLRNDAKAIKTGMPMIPGVEIKIKKNIITRNA